MITFYIAGAIMIAAALLAVVLPLLKTRVAEVDPASAEGISAESNSQRGRLFAVIAVVILIPVSAVLLYREFGRPHWQQEMAAAQAAAQPKDMRDVQAMVAKLEQRLRDKPNDADGWELLGRSYVILEKIPEAVAAYEKALAQNANSPQIKLGLGEALAMQDEKSLSGRAGDLFDAVLVQLPDNPKALWYGAISSLSRGNLLQGRERLQHMLALNPPASIRSILERQIQDISQQLASAGKQPADTSATTSAGNSATGTSVIDRDHPPENASEHVLQLSVSLAPALKNKLDKTNTLFVLARVPNAGGPPLAAVRRSASELPLSITLSEQNAMIPGHGIDSVSTVQVVARLSKSGTPQQQSGDLYGEANYTFTSSAKKTSGKNTLTIVIDRIAP